MKEMLERRYRTLDLVKSKKALEMKIVMIWLFILIAAIVVLFLIGYLGKESNNIVDLIAGLF